MSANNTPAIDNGVNNNNNNTDNNQSVRPKVVTNDNISLKSETSSICRPLKFGPNEDKEPNISQINENKANDVYTPCEISDGTVGSRSSRFPTIGQCHNDSVEERTVCCANVAINLYNKALESAKRALPNKSKQSRHEFPRSFGEDFESLGPEGFNYLDDGQTECSYDYKDIEFNRDSMFRPDVLAQTHGLPVLIDPNTGDEPTNLCELQARYGLPEEADRVQPYVPQTAQNAPVFEPKLRRDSKTEAKTEVAINRSSDISADTSDTTTNAVEDGVIVKNRFTPPEVISKICETPEQVEETVPIASTSAPVFETNPSLSPESLNTDAENVVNDCMDKNMGLSAPEIHIERCDSLYPMNMDMLAKRTSQLIIEDAIESIVKSKLESNDKNETKPEKLSKKSSTESAKELKKERKLLEKKLKEEEKSRRRKEKENKTSEKKESKKLFDRFRSDDKQKKKIMKKQKQFEKLKQKSFDQKSKNSAKNTEPIDIEADDEYEPTSAHDKPYEDIDESEVRVKSKVEPLTELVENGGQTTPKVMVEDVVKYEFIENIREIGVTYVPSDDGIENENYVEDTENGGRKSKSRVSSFRLPFRKIFEKKSSKTIPKVENRTEIIVTEPVDSGVEVVTTDTGHEITVDSTTSAVDSSNRYENVENWAKFDEPVVGPSISVNEVMVSQWETEDEDRQFIDRVSRDDSSPKIVSKKRKKSKTRAKLDRFKAKAMESLPKITSIVPKVKGWAKRSGEQPSPQHRDVDYQRFVSDHTTVHHSYDYSDFDCVSDSELCDSLRRTGGLRRHHVYEEMAATQERLDAYMSPVSGPLRPPRRFSSLKNVQKVSSVPSLATQVMFRPKRIPPPRPPPPRPPTPVLIPRVTVMVSSDSADSTLKRRPKQKVPPNIYYNNLRLNYKPKRRFIHLKQQHMDVLATYDQPKPPLPYIYGQRPTARPLRTESLNRVQQKNALNKEFDRKYTTNTMPLKQKYFSETLICDGRRPGPTPPPRRRRIAQRSQTVDPLFWRPFMWKYKRCRSLTELDVRRRADLRSEKGPKYENFSVKARDYSKTTRATQKPTRPPLPSGSLLSSKRFISDNYHIYSSVSKGVPQKGHNWKDRPLPAPPVPPRPKCVPTSVRPLEAPPSPKPNTRDVSVSTKDNGLVQMCEKQTQIDETNQSFREDLNGNELDLDFDRTPTNPLTPTTPTNPHIILFPIMGSPNGSAPHLKQQLAEQCAEGLSEYNNTLSSITTTNWYDAEIPPPEQPGRTGQPSKDWDEETINDDISSITSNYQSFSSDVTVTQSREETPVPQEVPEYQSDPTQSSVAQVVTSIPRAAPKPAVRSNSTQIVRSEPTRPVTRRSLPMAVTTEAEDNEETFGMSRQLHAELKQILEKKASTTRPESITSSEASLQEIIMTNTSSSSDDCLSKRHSASVDSIDSQAIDSSSDGDDYSLSSANEQSPEYHKRKQQQKLYFIAKELYSSEEVFIDVLHLLNNDFRGAVEQHIPEDVLQSIIKLLPQLLQINEQLLSDLKARIDDWPQHQRISDVLVKICPFLKQYSLYIRDFESMSANYDEAVRRYPSFAQAVKEFESTARCQKLSVKHYMLKPVQRLPQYRLLLQDYLRHLTPDSDDYLDTCNALQIVSQVAEHANNSMKSNENISKLLSIQNSIIGGTEVIKPGRLFIKEGELMKLSRKGMQERWFILFNDCLMYLTAVQNGVFRVNHELCLTGMRVSLPSQQDFQNEFSVISKTRSFSLAARSTKEREEWVSELSKAIKENTNKRISFAKSGSICNESPPELELGICAPVWIPDARVTMCQLCTEEFSVTFRRHHCRCCGKVVCSACSQNKAPLPYLKNRTARVCDECFEKFRVQADRLDSQTNRDSHVSASSGEVVASASDTDEGWSLKEWRQQFARNLIRSSNRKAKHRYVPSVLKEVSANDVGSLISGYLHRRESKRNWKRYWFVIKDLVLYTYKASEDVAALKSLPLLGFKVESLRESVDGIDQKSLFQLSHPGQPTLIFRAETIGSAQRWFNAMQTATTLE